MNKFRYRFVSLQPMTIFEILTSGCYEVLYMHRDQSKLCNKDELNRLEMVKSIYKIGSMSPIGTNSFTR